MSVFQGVKIGVIIQLKIYTTPFMISLYCVSHHKNLAVQTFFMMGHYGENRGCSIELVLLFLS